MFRRKSQPERQERPRLQRPTNYPSGSVVDTGADVYLIKGKTKFKFYSPLCLESWGFRQILPGSTESVSKFLYGGHIGFRDGSLIKNFADGKIYLIADNKRRHVQNPHVMEEMGYDLSKAIVVSNKEAEIQSEGEPIE